MAESRARRLENLSLRRQEKIQHTISERNARFFEAEIEKLEGWADDLKLGLEREIKDIDRQIKEARRTATAALTLEEKLAAHRLREAQELGQFHSALKHGAYSGTCLLPGEDPAEFKKLHQDLVA
jgi:hypothetical protein